MRTVAELMTDTVFTLQPTDSLSDVRSLMHLAKIRHTPVTDDEGNFQGLITNRDLLDCTISRLAEIDKAVQDEIDTAIGVTDVMRRDVVCVAPIPVCVRPPAFYTSINTAVCRYWKAANWWVSSLRRIFSNWL